MVQQENSTMGEDRTSTCVEKKNIEVINSCRHRHSSVISSCSEDAESESTSAGYPSTPDEEREEELQYGPGIVNKLKTRYLSIALKQNRGTNMRRSCSMENLLDQDRSSKTSCVDSRLAVNGISNHVKNAPVLGNLKRAKSMDTLLMDLQSESTSVKDLTNGDDKKEPKVIRRLEGGLNRAIPIISDEELPKPDTVKTYKRMFEPAESRRGSYCRRPPVLRASAKASAASKSNGILLNQSAKVNGTSLKTKISAKQSSAVKAQSNGAPVNGVNGIVKKSSAKDPTRPLYNGCHVAKHNPIKIINGVRSNKDIEKEMNNINSFISKREQVCPKADVITNGNSNHKDSIKNNLPEKNMNTRLKDSPGVIISKPQVPFNRPTLKPPKPPPKTVHLDSEKKEILVKLKPTSINGFTKISEPEKIASKIPVETFRKEEKKESEVQPVEECKPPEVSKIKNGFLAKEQCKAKIEKFISPLKDDLKINKSTPEKKLEKAHVIVDNNKLGKQKFDSDKPITENIKPGIKKTENENMVADSKKLGNVNTESDNLVIDSKLLNSKKSVSENSIVECKQSSPIKTETMDTPVKMEPKPVKKLTPSPSSTSMVFDFRGKDVVAHVAVVPAPFGCKSLHPKKRSILIEGKVPSNGNGAVSDDEDEEYVDYSVPPPSGVIFEGENVKIGRGSILLTRNKDLKITFDDDVDGNTFVYPSESSLLEDVERSPSSASTSSQPSDIPPPTPPKLKNNTVIGTSGPGGGLSSYTPSVLRTMDNFEPGMFRPPPAPVLPDKEEDSRQEKEEEENTEFRTGAEDSEMLKPADPDIISSWSISAGTSDLLF